MSATVRSQFEWVSARAACLPVKVFEELMLQVTSDVEIRNRMSEGRGYRFEMHVETNGFMVFLDSQDYRYVRSPYRLTRFFLEGQQITARYADETEIFSATPTLNDDGECRLKIKDKNYELWQVRHMALDKLFFELFKP